MGFDSFGLPSENAAISEGGHPREITERNIVSDHALDEADRVVARLVARAVHAPARLLPLAAVAVPASSSSTGSRTGRARPSSGARTTRRWSRTSRCCRTGRCERCGALVESRVMEQWFFKITDYAQALLDDLETVDWPESIKARQRNWIGRSEGAELSFRIDEWDEDDRRLHDASGHALRRDLLRARAGARARRPDRVRRRAGVRPRRPLRSGPRSVPPPRRRQASSPGCTPSTRSTASESRSTSPTTS